MTDTKIRCFGNKPDQELYAQYHDHEWGVPVHEDKKLFEMLILEGAQAGLNWETILKRRKAYQKAFYDFDPVAVAAMQEAELEALCHNETIIRNRLKIYAARQNARVFIKIQGEFGSFNAYLWPFVCGKTIYNHWQNFANIPAKTKESECLSKDLKKRGMNFVGPTIIYAFMQAVGMVNDHLVSCPQYQDYRLSL